MPHHPSCHILLSGDTGFQTISQCQIPGYIVITFTDSPSSLYSQTSDPIHATLFYTVPILVSITRCPHPKIFPFTFYQNKYIFMQTNYLKVCLSVHQPIPGKFKFQFVLEVVYLVGITSGNILIV